MSSEPVLESPESQPPSPSLPFPTAWWGRVLYGLFVTVMPILSFWGTELLKPEWQNGQLSSYVILSLFPKASLFFFPLLVYSVVAYWLLLYIPARFSESFIVRTGIYTGTLLAFQYSIVLLIYSLDSSVKFLLVVWISPFILFWIYRLTVAKWSATIVNVFLLVFVLLAGLAGILLIRGSLPVLVLVLLIMVAPLWCFLIALRVAIWLLKNHETNITLSRGLGIAAWLSAYAFAWRYDILKMFELYQALPTKPPQDCYIATAAAQGHPRIVGSRLTYRGDGLSMRVNGQLQHLKCAELAFMAVSPRVHGVLRRIYDVVGKFLAQRMTNPFVADAAYLLLKPVEWFTVFILKKIVPEIESLSRGMYIDQ